MPQSGHNEEPDGYAWYVVGVLILAYLVSLMDRQILTLLVQPIRRDLGISDTQMSLLIGFAFAMLYSVLGIPIARLADRSSRRNIIAVGVFFWSLMTAGCGLARNFWQLFLARMGVGVGEATLQPSAYSLLADYFPPSKLGRAIGTYVTGLFIGSGLAMILGGAVIQQLETVDSLVLPLIGEIRPWQMAFLVVGLPGVLISVLVMLTVREPPRRGRRNAAQDGVALSELWAFVRLNAASITAIFLAFALGGITVVGFLAWIPEMMRRAWGWNIADAGYVFGIEMAVLGTAGAMCGGAFSDWLARRGHSDAPLRAALYVFALLLPLAVTLPLVSDTRLGVILLGALVFVISLQQGLSPVALQLMSPNELRAQMIAIFFLAANFTGISLGPTSIALVTDYLFAAEQRLGDAMALVAAITMSLATLVLVWGLRHYRESMERSRQWLE